MKNNTPAIALYESRGYSVVRGSGGGGRGLHSFPFQLNLSSSVHHIIQLNS